MWFLSYKNIQRRRGQAVVTIVITMITIFVFTVVLGLMQVIQEGITLSRAKMGADAILIPMASSIESQTLLFTANPENVYMPASIVDKVAELEGVKAFTPQFYAQTLALDCCTPGEEIRIIGVEYDTDFVLNAHFSGQSAGTGKENEIILGSNFPTDVVGFDYLVLGEKFFVSNQLQPTGTGMDNTLFMDINACRNLAQNSPYLNLNWGDQDPFTLISVVMIKLEEGVDPEAFVDIVKQSGIDAKVILTDRTITAVQNQLAVLMSIFILFWIAIMAVAVLSLFGRFNGLAHERKKEIGLLRAMGLKKKQIFTLVVMECSIMALIGGFIGSLLATWSMGTIIEWLKDVFMLSPSVWNLQLALLGSLLGILLALLLGILSAAYPAWKSASLDPQVALTEGEI